VPGVNPTNVSFITEDAAGTLWLGVERRLVRFDPDRGAFDAVEDAARPDDSGLQYGLGAVLYVQGHLAEASARLKDSVRLQPDQLAAPYYLALAERDQGHDAVAIGILRALLQRHPEHAASYEALGGLLMTAQKYEEAEVNLQKAVQLNPKSVKANYQLGLLLARLGRKEEADKQLALAKTLRQDDEATSRLQLRLIEPAP